MSNRRTNGGVGPTPAPSVRAVPLPSLYDIGRQIVVLGKVGDGYDEKELDRSLTFKERKRLEKAKSLVFTQEEALVDLGLAMTPETVRDVVAQLVLADRRLDEIVACDMSIEEIRTIAANALRVVRSSLPLLARAAQIDLAEVAGHGMVVMAAAFEHEEARV
jgi:hypothetical protein